MLSRRLAAMVVAWLAFGACAGRAWAQAACPDSVTRWAQSCEAHGTIVVRAVQCSDGVVVIRAGGGATGIDVEIRGADRRRGFVREAGFDLSPIGEFADWNTVAPEIRAGFERVRECIASAPIEVRASAFRDVRTVTETPRPGWRGGLFLSALVGLFMLWATGGGLRRRFPDIAVGTVVAIGVAVVRRSLIDPAYFHQNGQGPMWVRFAYCERSSYGPGQSAVYGWAARAVPHSPWTGVFEFQSFLAALAAGALYSIARRSGLSRVVSFALAVGACLHPLVARLSRSESYYGTILSLLTLAIAALALADPRGRAFRIRTIVAALVSGAFVATAASVHPVAWVASALVPSFLLVRRGPTNRTVVLALVSAAIIALVTALVALGPMRELLRVDLGQRWSGVARSSVPLLPVASALVLPWLAALAMRWRARRVLPVVVVASALAVGRYANILGATTTFAPAESWRLLFRVTALCASMPLLASIERSLRGRRVSLASIALASAIILAFAVSHARSFAHWTALPTDALEARWFLTRIRALSPNARVYYLGRAGLGVLDPGFYDRCRSGLARSVQIESERGLPRANPGDYYFRTSLCSMRAGRETCARIEREWSLVLLESVRLPARRSLEHVAYDTDAVEIGVFRLR